MQLLIKGLLIKGIALLIILIVVGAGFLYLKWRAAPETPQIPSSTETITPTEAYALCTKESCPSGEVYIRGEMGRRETSLGSFFLRDDTHAVFFSLQESNLSFPQVIRFHEKASLQKEGIIDAQVKGKMSHSIGLCTMDQCKDIVSLVIDPEEVQVLQKMRCKDASEGKSTLEQGNCFDVSYRKMSLERAYTTLLSSKICTERGRRPSYDATYDAQLQAWIFGMASPRREGGCSESCIVFENNVSFVTTCAARSYGDDVHQFSVDEQVTPKSLENLYAECKQNWQTVSSARAQPLPPAENEPIGATRRDSEGNVWKKIDKDSWESSAKGYERTRWGNTLIDEQPGGIDYNPDIIECDMYLKP